jgi:hypothetical protein
VKSKIVRFVSIPEIIATWAVQKTLDFVLRRAVKRGRRYIQHHDFRKIFMRINDGFMLTAVSGYVEEPKLYA